MSKVATKMIKVTSRGMVTTSRGKVHGPINYPYRESVDKIWNMLTVEGATVFEQLLDKSFIKLDTQNFDKNNNIPKTVEELHDAVSEAEPEKSLTGARVGDLNAKVPPKKDRRNKKNKKNKQQNNPQQTVTEPQEPETEKVTDTVTPKPDNKQEDTVITAAETVTEPQEDSIFTEADSFEEID